MLFHPWPRIFLNVKNKHLKPFGIDFTFYLAGIDRHHKLFLVENGKKQLQRLGAKSNSFIPTNIWVYGKDVYILEPP